MMVHLRIQHPLRQPLLQFIDQPAAFEHRCRVATGQKLIHHLIRDSLILVRRHTLPPALPGVIVWLEHEISDTLPTSATALLLRDFVRAAPVHGHRRSRADQPEPHSDAYPYFYASSHSDVDAYSHFYSSSHPSSHANADSNSDAHPNSDVWSHTCAASSLRQLRVCQAGKTCLHSERKCFQRAYVE